MSDSPDDPLAAARAGDRRAVERLLADVFPRVMRTCRGILGATAQAEDACQESLIELVRALPRFRGEGSINGYATRITIRTAMRLRRASPRALALDDAREPVSPGEQAEDSVTGGRRRRVLRELLDELPSEQAETVALRFLLGHSLDEVAAITETPRNTVRSRLRLAKNAMIKRIESDPALTELLRGQS